jgi:hypothetical protein
MNTAGICKKHIDNPKTTRFILISAILLHPFVKILFDPMPAGNNFT